MAAIPLAVDGLPVMAQQVQHGPVAAVGQSIKVRDTLGAGNRDQVVEQAATYALSLEFIFNEQRRFGRVWLFRFDDVIAKADHLPFTDSYQGSALFR